MVSRFGRKPTAKFFWRGFRCTMARTVKFQCCYSSKTINKIKIAKISNYNKLAKVLCIIYSETFPYYIICIILVFNTETFAATVDRTLGNSHACNKYTFSFHVTKFIETLRLDADIYHIKYYLS